MKIMLKDEKGFIKLLMSKGYTRRSFSIELGISHPYLYQIVNGTRSPSPRVARKIAEKLEVDFEEIFEIVDL